MSGQNGQNQRTARVCVSQTLSAEHLELRFDLDFVLTKALHGDH